MVGAIPASVVRGRERAQSVPSRLPEPTTSRRRSSRFCAAHWSRVSRRSLRKPLSRRGVATTASDDHFAAQLVDCLAKLGDTLIQQFKLGRELAESVDQSGVGLFHAGAEFIAAWLTGLLDSLGASCTGGRRHEVDRSHRHARGERCDPPLAGCRVNRDGRRQSTTVAPRPPVRHDAGGLIHIPAAMSCRVASRDTVRIGSRSA
jgi:hypothetical protein